MISQRRSIIALFAAFAVMFTAAFSAMASEQTPPPNKRHARVYVERDYPYECRTGWWQAWRYGREWPRWGTLCRR